MISGLNNNILAGKEDTRAMGKIVNKAFLNIPEYMESGRLEYLINSLASQPPTEKFLYQKTKHAIINSTQYKIKIPIKNEKKNII